MNNHPVVLVSVIIPVHNDSANLGKCLDAVYRSTYPTYEVIVIDDGSSDESAEVAKRFPTQTIKLSQQQGPAAARNRGAALAKGAALLFLDADVIVQPETLSILASGISGDTAAVLAQYDDGVTFANFASQYKNLWLCYMFLNAPLYVSWFWSGCGMVLREAFFEAGGFDEQLRECEDYALGYHLSALGKAIRLDHQVKVVHRHHRSVWQLVKSDFKRARDNVKILLSESRISDNSFATQHNIFKVLLAYTFLVTLIAGWLFPLIWIMAAIAGGLFTILNGRFFAYLQAKTSPAFCIRAGFLTYIIYLNMGFGAFIGLTSWLCQHKLKWQRTRIIL